jgi:hypothetical protein
MGPVEFLATGLIAFNLMNARFPCFWLPEFQSARVSAMQLLFAFAAPLARLSDSRLESPLRIRLDSVSRAVSQPESRLE